MITRSLGIAPGLPWGGPRPGGGYEGKTKRLDLAVARFAAFAHLLQSPGGDSPVTFPISVTPS